MSKTAADSKQERILAVLRAGQRDDDLLAQNPGVLEPATSRSVPGSPSCASRR